MFMYMWIYEYLYIYKFKNICATSRLCAWLSDITYVCMKIGY